MTDLADQFPDDIALEAVWPSADGASSSNPAGLNGTTASSPAPTQGLDTPAYLVPGTASTANALFRVLSLYAVDLQAGETYHFATNGQSSVSPLLALTDESGGNVTTGGISGFYFRGQLDYTADHTGRYYLVLTTQQAGGATVQLSYTQTSADPVDSVPGSTVSGQSLAIGGSVQGTVDFAGDSDWYRVHLTAGQSYAFSLQGQGPTPLTDTFVQVRDATDGHVLTFNDDADAQHNSYVRFTPLVSGDYFVAASDWDTELGGYSLSAAAVAPQDPLATITSRGPHLQPDIKVYFGLASDVSGGTFTGGRAWSQSEIDQVLAAMRTYSSAVNVTFTQVNQASQATLVLALASLSDGESGAQGITLVNASNHADIVFDPNGDGWTAQGLRPGGEGFSTITHEIGHALGLAHPHDIGGGSEIMEGVYQPFGAYGSAGLDQGIFTTMSYNSGYPGGMAPGIDSPDEAGPMALDLAVLQRTYGAAANNTGDSVYAMSAAMIGTGFTTIWDSGGYDTITASADQGAVIDLRPASLLNQPGGGGYVSYINPSWGGFTIAAGVQIEAAIGTSWDDRIQGNALNNRLDGAGGNDKLYGDDGDDVIFGGTGEDYLYGGAGADELWGEPQNSGSASLGYSDRLYGGIGDDVLHGSAALDYLVGGPGNDLLISGEIPTSGHVLDTASYYDAPGGVTVSLAITGPQDTVSAGIDTLVGMRTLEGSAFNDVLTGAGDFYSLQGDAGDDRLILNGPGQTFIDGGTGVDTLVFTGARSAYTLTSTSSGGVAVTGPNGSDDVIRVEFLQFSDQTFHFRPGVGTTVNFSANPSTYAGALRDFDGNDLGGGGSWVLAGHVDIQGDGDQEYILFNSQIGRWATIGPAEDGKVYFDDHGWAGDTRVVGIYIDPEVVADPSKAGGPFDSQRRFQNDLNIGNLKGILGAGDYNHDGLQEVYFSLTDGTAYLHAYMHADGNIQYANYQSQQQVIDYLTANGFNHTTWDGWF